MSFTGFLFGNIDDDGNLDNGFFDPELQATLVNIGDEGNSFLASVMGRGVFDESIEKSSSKSKPTDKDLQRLRALDNAGYEDDVTPIPTSPITEQDQSQYIRPSNDAIDYSNFDELAADDEGAIQTSKTELPSSPPGLQIDQSHTPYYPGTGYTTPKMFSKVDVDEDYDMDEDDEEEKIEKSPQEMSGVKFPMAMGTPDPNFDSTLFKKPHDSDTSKRKEVYVHHSKTGGGGSEDEDMLEDLFHSPTKEIGDEDMFGDNDLTEGTSTSKQDTGEAQEREDGDALVDGKRKHDKDDTAFVFDPTKPLKFTDMFQSKIVQKPFSKKPRKVTFAETEPESPKIIPNVDTRKLLERKETTQDRDQKANVSFLRKILQEIRGQTTTSEYVILDEDGQEVPVTLSGKEAENAAIDLHHTTPATNELNILDIDPWEEKIIWDSDDNNNLNNNNNQGNGNEKALTKTIINIENKDLDTFKNVQLDDGRWLESIIWGTGVPFKPFDALHINMNDPHILFEDGEEVKRRNAREAERNRIMEGVDQYNLSNDHFYEALKEGKVQRVRQTFGQLIVAHSLPSAKVMGPFFKLRLSRKDLKWWHRPHLQVTPGMEIKFSKVRSSKKRKKQKEGPESLWGAKDITLRDSTPFILFEYAEETPPIMSNVGMGSVLVNYYRKRDIQDAKIPNVDFGELLILDTTDASPFMKFGDVEPGSLMTALYNNMTRAPLFQHTPNKTDFLAIRHVSKGEPKWYLRSIPYFFVVGQTYPVQEIPAPHSRKVTTTIRHRFQVAAYRLMNRNQFYLLQMSKIAKIFPEFSDLQIRQRLKEFCEYQRKGLGPGLWRTKYNMPIPDEEGLRKMLTPEMLCLFESMLYGQQRLHEAGYRKWGEKEDDPSDENPDTRLSIDEQLAPWCLTRNFINAIQGKAMLKLYGEGDPTDCGEGFSFLRISMKDIFLRAGESIEEKLAEIEARPKSAHRYNVAEQQQIYREEVEMIWQAQKKSLTKNSHDIPESEHDPRVYDHTNQVVVSDAEDTAFDDDDDDDDHDGSAESEKKSSSPSTKPIDSLDELRPMSMQVSDSIVSPAGFSGNPYSAAGGGGGADSQREAEVGPGQSTDSANAAYKALFSQSGNNKQQDGSNLPPLYIRNKHLVIRRAVRSPYTGETTWRVEVIKDFLVIKAYLRQRRIIEMKARKQRQSLQDTDDWGQLLCDETTKQLNNLRSSISRQREKERNRSSKHMSTFALAQPNKPKKEVIRRCGNCGELGHMKTNKKCPRYYEFNTS